MNWASLCSLSCCLYCFSVTLGSEKSLPVFLSMNVFEGATPRLCFIILAPMKGYCYWLRDVCMELVRIALYLSLERSFGLARYACALLCVTGGIRIFMYGAVLGFVIISWGSLLRIDVVVMFGEPVNSAELCSTVMSPPWLTKLFWNWWFCTDPWASPSKL